MSAEKLTPKLGNSPEREEQCPSEFVLKIKEILLKNGISEPVSEVILKDSGLRGENFLSITNYVTVKFAQESGKAPLHLFIKKRIGNESYDQFAVENKVFEKESTFFTEFVPFARSYCKSVGKEEFADIYPKCYFGNKDLLVFENLVLNQGFFIMDKIQRQDFEAATFALQNLAKHHAISHAVINEIGGVDKFLEKFPDFNLKPFASPSAASWLPGMIEKGVVSNIELLKKSVNPERQLMIKKLEDDFLGSKPFQIIAKLLNDQDNPFCTLNHGDYWNNNMMFLKDTETNKIISQIQVDFQVVQYGSPSVDLGYYFFTSVQCKLRQERIGELLRIYYNALKLYTEELGYPISLTWEQMKKDYCKNFQIGFHFGNMMVSDAGLEVLKDIDVNNLSGIGDLGDQIDILAKQWLEKHPEKIEEYAGVVIDELKEYDRLRSGIIN